MSIKLPEPSYFYDIFKLPKQYFLDKNILKKKYYDISKQTHPDIQNSTDQYDSGIINKAYSVLNDDFERAKLFTPQTCQPSLEFLDQCLELENRIKHGEDMRRSLENKIEECKKHYYDPNWVGKWAFYRRLLKMIDRTNEK